MYWKPEGYQVYKDMSCSVLLRGEGMLIHCKNHTTKKAAARNS
jgi:hypothetical protein